MGNLDTSAARGKPQAGGQKCRWGSKGQKKFTAVARRYRETNFASNFNFYV